MKNIPTSEEFLKIAYNRGLLHTEEELRNYRRVQAGADGEDKFHEILKEVGREHWGILRNTWFHHFSNFECDSIVITASGVFVFEVKKYHGKFVYDNGQCSSRGVDITYNPINQANNALTHLRNLTRKFSSAIDVRGVLVFIGEHNQVFIQDDIDYIEILECNEVYDFIQEMVREENRSGKYSINIDKLVQHYKRHEVPHPYPPKAYTSKLLDFARTGFSCARCASFDITVTRSHIICPCGLHEPREEAFVRTACEYGVLTYGDNFTVPQIRQFIKQQVSYNNLVKILVKHFKQVTGTKVLTFENFGRDYLKVKTQFDLPLPKQLVFHDWDALNS